MCIADNNVSVLLLSFIQFLILSCWCWWCFGMVMIESICHNIMLTQNILQQNINKSFPSQMHFETFTQSNTEKYIFIPMRKGCAINAIPNNWMYGYSVHWIHWLSACISFINVIQLYVICICTYIFYVCAHFKYCLIFF